MSIMDVAREAGVSVASVSRVVNGVGGVSADTAERVREVMRKLGYVPPSVYSRFRRSPRKRRGIHAGTVSFLVPDTDSGALRTVLMGRVLHGIEPSLKAQGLQLRLASLAAPDTPPDSIAPGKTDGVILRCCEHADRLDFRLRDVPHVWIFESQEPPRWGDQVLPNNDLVGQYAARYLLSRGRRRWAFLAATDQNPARGPWIRNRSRSFREVAQDGGIEYGEAVARAPAGQLLDRLFDGGRGPDGIFIPLDELQVAPVYRALRARGIEPGRDVDVVCCGHDEHRMSLLHPVPASVDIQPEAIGAAAVEMLLWRMANPEAPQRQTTITPLLVVPEGGVHDPEEPSSGECCPGEAR